jgi:hypothetical protein
MGVCDKRIRPSEAARTSPPAAGASRHERIRAQRRSASHWQERFRPNNPMPAASDAVPTRPNPTVWPPPIPRLRWRNHTPRRWRRWAGVCAKRTGPGATIWTNAILPAAQAPQRQAPCCTNEPERDVDAPTHRQERCWPNKPGPAVGDALLARTNPSAGPPPVIPGLDQRLTPGPPRSDGAVLVPTGAGPVKPNEPIQAREQQSNRRANEPRGGVAGPSAGRNIPVRTNPSPPSAQAPPCKRTGAAASFRSPPGPDGTSGVALVPIEPDRARRHEGTRAGQRHAHPRTSEPGRGVAGRSPAGPLPLGRNLCGRPMLRTGGSGALRSAGVAWAQIATNSGPGARGSA